MRRSPPAPGRSRWCRSSAAPYSDNLCARRGSGRHLHRQDRGLRARRRHRPHPEGLQRPAGRRGRDDPLQPDPGRHRDRQPLPARRCTWPTAPTWSRSSPATPASPATFTAGTDRARTRATSWRRSPRGARSATSSSRTSRLPASRSWPATRRRPDSVDGGPAGQYWQAIAGTSMSSPHIAGAALLVKAVAPGLDPGPDQVGHDDAGHHQGGQGGPHHAGRPVRHGCGPGPRWATPSTRR